MYVKLCTSRTIIMVMNRDWMYFSQNMQSKMLKYAKCELSNEKPVFLKQDICMILTGLVECVAHTLLHL